MKFITGLSLIASALAVSIDLEKRDGPLAVTIESIGNSAVKATITNTGSEAIKVFKTGSLLDSTAVEKAEIFTECKCYHFEIIPFFHTPDRHLSGITSTRITSC